MRAWILVLPLLVACKKKAPEAPKELADLGLFFMAHFEDEDPGELGAAVLNLAPWVRDEDYSLSVADRAFAMPILDGDNLGSLSIPSGVSAEDQLPLALSSISPHPLAKQFTAIQEKNRVCLSSDSTVWSERIFSEGEDCIADGGCDFAAATTEERKETIIADVWLDNLNEWRTVEAEDEDGNVTQAIIGRYWTEEQFPADGGGSTWDQLFQLDVYIEDGNQTLRWFVMWSSVNISILTDDGYVDLVRDGIDESYTWTDTFIGGTVDETCKNDRNLAKPPR